MSQSHFHWHNLSFLEYLANQFKEYNYRTNIYRSKNTTIEPIFSGADKKGMREINQSSPEATSHENRPASGNVCSQNRMYPKLIYFIQTYFLSKCKTEIKKSFHFSRFTQSLFKWVLAEGDSCNGAFFHFSFQQHQRKYWPQSSLWLPLGLFQQGKGDTSQIAKLLVSSSDCCLDLLQYLLNSKEISANTETAMLSSLKLKDSLSHVLCYKISK